MREGWRSKIVWVWKLLVQIPRQEGDLGRERSPFRFVAITKGPRAETQLQPTNSFINTYRGYFLLLRLWFNIFATVHSLGGCLISKHSHDAFLRLGGEFSVSVRDGFLLLGLYCRRSTDVSGLLQLHWWHGYRAGAADGAVPTVRP